LDKIKLTIATDKRFLKPIEGDGYIDNVILEDNLLVKELENFGFDVDRTYWDNPNYEWSSVNGVIIRAAWDYHYDIDRFKQWLELVESKTTLIHSKSIVYWNLNKSYLLDLIKQQIPVVSTHIVKVGESLNEIITTKGWQDIVIKPTVSAGGKDTFFIRFKEVSDFEIKFKELCLKQEMMVQPFMSSILSEGEITLVVLDGKYSHAIKKLAQKGDFRVQDDFGGTVHEYTPTQELIDFAEKVFTQLPFKTVYGRVDLIKNENKWLVSELELIEPELWFRNKQGSAHQMAKGIKKSLHQNSKQELVK